MPFTPEMFWVITALVVFVVIFEIVFWHYWEVQYHYPHDFSFSKYLKYVTNEIWHKFRRDKRCEFEREVDRREVLESTETFNETSGCSNSDHKRARG